MNVLWEREMTRSTLRLVTTPPPPSPVSAVERRLGLAVVTHAHSRRVASGTIVHSPQLRIYRDGLSLFLSCLSSPTQLCPLIFPPSRARCLGRSSQILPPNGDGDGGRRDGGSHAPQPRASHPSLPPQSLFTQRSSAASFRDKKRGSVGCTARTHALQSNVTG